MQPDTATRRASHGASLCDRLLAMIRVDESTGCWRWTGCVVSRYGAIAVTVDGKRKLLRAHRVAYEAFVGPIPHGLRALHRCDVATCINPDHIFLGTQQDNMRDMVRKGRKYIARGTAASWAKLTERDVLAIRAAHAGGESIGALAGRFKIARATARRAISGQNWGHVGNE